MLDLHCHILPNVDDGAFSSPMGNTFRKVTAAASSKIVVRTLAASEAVRRAIGNLALTIVKVNPLVHAKIYIASAPDGQIIALIGSHTLWEISSNSINVKPQWSWRSNQPRSESAFLALGQISWPSRAPIAES